MWFYSSFVWAATHGKRYAAMLKITHFINHLIKGINGID